MRAIYKGPNAEYGNDPDDNIPMKVGEVYKVAIRGDFYDVYDAETNERIWGWCGSTDLNDLCEDWFVLQVLPETITRQIQEKLQFLCIDAYEAGLTARDKNEERVITGAVVNERIGLVLSAIKELLEGQTSE